MNCPVCNASINVYYCFHNLTSDYTVYFGNGKSSTVIYGNGRKLFEFDSLVFIDEERLYKLLLLK
jgi:hypothetical protein